VTPPAPGRPRVVEAAGALVWRERKGVLQVALVHRPRYKDWSWPKGKLDPGEVAPIAAVREVAEETGRTVVLGIPLPGLRYALSDGRRKHVHYWAARLTERSDKAVLRARPAVVRASADEIDEMRWLEVTAADRKLTRAADRAPLAALVHAHRKGRLDSRALVVARHGRAVTRSAWKGGELGRPLTPSGKQQARALVPVLAAFGVRDVVSSQWARCAQSVEPYAGAAGVPVRISRVLTEAEHGKSPARVAAEVRHLLESQRGTVLCTHRPVLPTVLDVVGQHARRSVADDVPVEDPFLLPGEVLVAHVTDTRKGPRVIAVERHRPPSR
jgi:8-oxo-dGTP pyrophosphatase MutT (NUDIX family)/phosphohistidine phosphatase SixA